MPSEAHDYGKLRDEIDRLLSLEKDGKICAGLYATVAEFQHIKAALSLAADAGRYRETLANVLFEKSMQGGKLVAWSDETRAFWLTEADRQALQGEA